MFRRRRPAATALPRRIQPPAPGGEELLLLLLLRPLSLGFLSADGIRACNRLLQVRLKPCMPEIYLHIVARMADYMATHLHSLELRGRQNLAECGTANSQELHLVSGINLARVSAFPTVCFHIIRSLENMHD